MTPADPHRSLQRRGHLRGGGWCLTWALLASNTLLVQKAAALTITMGGEIAVSSDGIYRGLSESSGRPAAAIDLHAATTDGTFAGAFTTTRDSGLPPGAAAAVDVYLGQRLDLDGDWSARLTAYSHQYLGGDQTSSDDYQELAAQLSYLDLWSLSLAALPNAVRYVQPAWPGAGYRTDPVRIGRYAASVAATQLQWLITSRLLITAAAGYYFMLGGADAYPALHGARPLPTSASGYAYGDAGVAYQYRRWRLDVAYFLADARAAAQLYPFPAVNKHVAATLSWRF